jgi:ZIP family zinc transporter
MEADVELQGDATAAQQQGGVEARSHAKAPPTALVRYLTLALLAVCALGVYRCSLILSTPSKDYHTGSSSGSSSSSGSGSSGMTLEEVFWASFGTCVATGLGAAPFFFLTSLPSDWLLGVSNAAAAGMMLAASATLAAEGCTHEGGGLLPTALGAAVGVGAILATKPLLDSWGGSESVFRGMEAANARKAFLLCLVMFAHSATEGVSIGVSYTDQRTLGRFVALSLAIHNIPEGLVTCLALVPRGVPPLEAALWAVFTSLSQPLMAPLAYYWLTLFSNLLAPGLGFAGGAMTFVACWELLPEARERLAGKGGTGLLAGVTVLAAGAMCLLNVLVKE